MRNPHRYARTLLLVLAGLALAGWLVPPFFHTGRYRRILETSLESKLGRPVELGTVTFRLLPHPGFSIDRVVVEEDPQFGSEPFARVERLECDLRWRSLWGSHLDCARILLDHPTLNFVRNRKGVWNVEYFLLQSSLGSRKHSTQAGATTSGTFAFEIQSARVNFTVNAVKKPFILKDVDARLSLNPGGGLIRFQAAATPVRIDLPFPPPGRVIISGIWRPGKNFQGPLHATLSTQGSLLYGWLPLATGRDPELYGLVDAEMQLEGSFQQMNLEGRIHLDQLHRWESLPPLSSMPVEVSFAGSWDRPREKLTIRRWDAAFANSHLHLAGAIHQFPDSPQFDLVLDIQRSRVENLIAMGSRLTGHPLDWTATGRIDGLITAQGYWRKWQYGGLLTIHPFALRRHQLAISAPEVAARIDTHGLRLLPTHFTAFPHLDGVAEGFLTPVLPGEAPATSRENSSHASARSFKGRGTARRVRPAPNYKVKGRYELQISVTQAPLHDLLRLARQMNVEATRDLDAQGWATASIQLSGSAWPFTKPQLSSQGDLHSARLLVPTLTEPVRFKRFHFEIEGRNIRALPVSFEMGTTQFTGWLVHEGVRRNPWDFRIQTPHLSLEQASLWFSVLGHRPSLQILDLIPGLRTLAERRLAGRTIFASMNARGIFESHLLTFRSLKLQNFHAAIALSGREARISKAAFRVAGGEGVGSVQIDFKQAPARIAGGFRLSELKLHRMAWRLPSALRDMRGTAFAEGHFVTRGLTLPEISTNLRGGAEIQLRNVSFGNFDPVQAVAHAADWGSLEPDRDGVLLRSVDLALAAGNQEITLGPLRFSLFGGQFTLSGNYGFDGVANFQLRADLTHVRRQWVNDILAATPQDRIITFHLAGALNTLAVVPTIEAKRDR
jgi:hypothetical protein